MSAMFRTLLAIGVVFATLALPPGLAAADAGCVLSVDPREEPLGTAFTVTGSGFGEPTIVTIRFSAEEVSLTPATKVSEREVDVDEAGRFTLRLQPLDPAEIGFWVVSAVVPDTECGAETGFHVFGPPDTATDAATGTSGPSAPGLLFALAGVVCLTAALGRRRARQRG